MRDVRISGRRQASWGEGVIGDPLGEEGALGCLGSVPEDGSTRGAGTGFVVPRVGWVRTLRLGRWLVRRRRGLADAG